MIFYITSHANNQLICEAIEESEQKIARGKVEAKFNLTNYIKTELEKINIADTIIIDLNALDDKDEEIIETLTSLKLVDEKRKIIIIAPYRQKGSQILSEIVSLAIYNIVTYTEDTSYDEKKEDLKLCLTEGKGYRDSIHYKITKKKSEEKANTKEKIKTVVKEKVVVKKEIRNTVSKAIIGFIGAQHRIGTTHNAIVSAMFLKKLGYSVALVEKNSNKTKSLKAIKEENIENIDIHDENDEYFTYKGVDFYPSFDLKENYRLQAKNYNFIIEDFGEYQNINDLVELDRCIMQIVVGGYKDWETNKIDVIFDEAGDDRLMQYKYLFNFTSLTYEKEIRGCMAGIEGVYIAGYAPDPFCDDYESIKEIFKEYIPESINEEKGIIDKLKQTIKHHERIGEVFKKCIYLKKRK